jgi:hypothetical protein
VNPEIKRYLDEHGATYTPEALRAGLVQAGYDAGEVDAAISAWNAAGANRRGAESRRTFGRWALLLHVGVLVAVFVALVALKGTSQAGVALLGCAVLAVAMLIGWAISSLIGRALLSGTGVAIALIVPVISALVLGGACFAMMDSVIPTPPSDGTVHLKIDEPASFDESSGAACYVGGGSSGVRVASHELGVVEGGSVTVDLTWYPGGKGPAEGVFLSVSVGAESIRGRFYSVVPTTKLTVDASGDGRSGSIAFTGLAREPAGPDDTDLELSGSVAWTCE